MKGSKVTFDAILSQTRQYYDKKLVTYGLSPKGVDWNSAQSQELRFEQLLKVCNTSNLFTLNDYGCGYGALAAYMTGQDYRFEYNGFDLSIQMIDAALKEYGDLRHCAFVSDEESLGVADYTVASGIFNVKLQTSYEEWQGYVLHTLGKMAELSKKGFAFNALTKYSDPEFMRDDLFYADPLFLFDYCKRNFSRFVAVLHDYPLYEFTMLVRKEGK
jgi:SAM-dependent methyltransferase